MNAVALPAIAYEWLKALHIIAFVAWMAGLFYLPRLYVYHADSEPGSEQSETFKVMERRLLGMIMNPAMIATWVLGVSLASLGHLWTAPWLMTKLALVLVMTWFHFWLAARCREFRIDANKRPASTYRIINELPTLLLIGIVILAVVKPF
jgi:putative membrane protein